MKKHAEASLPTTLDMPNPASLNMAAKPEQEKSADANEVMLAMEQGSEEGKK